MIDKGFTESQDTTKTPRDINTEKPLKNPTIITKRVDINVLKSRIQERQTRENKQNISIFVFFVITLGALGIYLSA